MAIEIQRRIITQVDAKGDGWDYVSEPEGETLGEQIAQSAGPGSKVTRRTVRIPKFEQPVTDLAEQEARAFMKALDYDKEVMNRLNKRQY